jgi:hypothetical protein
LWFEVLDALHTDFDAVTKEGHRWRLKMLVQLFPELADRRCKEPVALAKVREHLLQHSDVSEGSLAC